MMKRFFLWFLAVMVLMFTSFFVLLPGPNEENFIAYTADPKTESIALYWKNKEGELIRSLGELEKLARSNNQELVFAMNAGMYTKERSALGLFIQDGKTITPLNTKSAKGNFYLKPNGVFYLTKSKKAVVCTTGDFKPDSSIVYATQSGPVLVMDGKLHPSFIKGSANLNVRNGVGILPDGKILFAISKQKINFYDFALYFKEKGCKNALYLDGHVSRIYCPQKNRVQKGGDFGVMIGITVPAKK